MPQADWSVLHHDADLRLDALQARFTAHAFARHWHDYYVIGLVVDGAQSFWCRRATYTTPRGGLILINPGEAHTGEAAGATGFAYRALYPTNAHMAQVMTELGQPDELPVFPSIRIDDNQMADAVCDLHIALNSDHTPLERESRWLHLLTALVARYGAERRPLPHVGREPRAVTLAQGYLEEHYAERVTLATLAAHAGISPFHLVRVFHRTTGVPPHTYLESIRIRHAQRLLTAGMPPAHVAYATGFSSQSHFTNHFRRIIGVTPGRYRGA